MRAVTVSSEVCDLPFVAKTHLAIDICEAVEVRDLAEYVLLQDMKQQSGELGVPYPALVDINLASQKSRSPGSTSSRTISQSLN